VFAMDVRSLRLALPPLDTSETGTSANLRGGAWAPSLLTARDRPTAFDIAAVLHLLSSPTSPLATRQRLLPPELALRVLDDAGYWRTMHYARSWRIRAPHRPPHDRAQATATVDGKLYLRTQPLARGTPRALRRVSVRIAAQGGAGVVGACGRDAGIWFELALLRPGLVAGVWTEPHPREELEWDSTDASAQVAVLEKVCPLLHLAAPGDAFGVFPRAAKGFVNHVEEIACTVYLGCS
jgi:hypothetical protein